MVDKADKSVPPAYTSYKSFKNFISGLREAGVPSRIDRSVLKKMSGSEQSAMIGSLRWLGLIEADGTPTADLHSIVDSNDAQYSIKLGQLLVKSYVFLTDKSIDLSRATGQQLIERFREFNASGSTIDKALGFFLSAAREAGITISPHMRMPTRASSKGGGPKRPKTPPALPEVPGSDPSPPATEGMLRITIPLSGMKEGVIYLPAGLDAKAWGYAKNMTKVILDNYRTDDTPAEGGKRKFKMV